MPNIYQFNETEILMFFLVLLRISTFIVTWPIFSADSVPVQLKILFALTLSMLVFPSVNIESNGLDLGSMTILWLFLKEIVFGLSLGFICRLFVYILSIAGEVISVSMGLSSTQLFDPTTGSRGSSLDRFYVGLGVLIFLAVNGHHVFLTALHESFQILPISKFLVTGEFFSSIGKILQHVTVLGIKIASPVMISIFIVNIAMAVIGRAVPQINVLITSLPVNIMIGFMIVIIGIPLAVWQMEGLVQDTAEKVFFMMKNY